MQKIMTRDSRRVGHPVVKIVETNDVNDIQNIAVVKAVGA